MIKCSSDMNVNYIFFLLSMSELYSFVNGMSNFFTESDNDFWIFEEYFLNFLVLFAM